MTTTVKVTAHNHRATVTVTNFSTVKGPTNVSLVTTTSKHILSDGQSQEFTVTETQNVIVHEWPIEKVDTNER
jgi:hypothetical protein